MIEQYYKDNFDSLVKRMNGRTRCMASAEDVVHDAFEKALKYGHTRSEDKEFGAWFNTIINNSYKNWVAVERRGGATVEYNEEKDLPVPMKDITVSSELQEEISKLPGNTRQAVHLYFNAGLRPKEIAEIIDMTAGGIAKAVSLFKKQIKEKNK